MSSFSKKDLGILGQIVLCEHVVARFFLHMIRCRGFGRVEQVVQPLQRAGFKGWPNKYFE